MDYQLPEPSSAQAPAQNLENVVLQILYPHLNFRVRSQLKKAGSQHKDSPITSCVAHGDVVAEVEEGGPVFISAPPHPPKVGVSSVVPVILRLYFQKTLMITLQQKSVTV